MLSGLRRFTALLVLLHYCVVVVDCGLLQRMLIASLIDLQLPLLFHLQKDFAELQVYFSIQCTIFDLFLKFFDSL